MKKTRVLFACLIMTASMFGMSQRNKNLPKKITMCSKIGNTVASTIKENTSVDCATTCCMQIGSALFMTYILSHDTFSKTN